MTFKIKPIAEPKKQIGQIENDCSEKQCDGKLFHEEAGDINGDGYVDFVFERGKNDKGRPHRFLRFGNPKTAKLKKMLKQNPDHPDAKAEDFEYDSDGVPREYGKSAVPKDGKWVFNGKEVRNSTSKVEYEGKIYKPAVIPEVISEYEVNVRIILFSKDGARKEVTPEQFGKYAKVIEE